MPVAFRVWLLRYWPMLSMLTLGLTASVWLGVSEHREARRSDERSFEIEVAQTVGSLQLLLGRYEERLGRLADHCALFDELPLMVWRFRQHSVMDFANELPAVMHALYCPRIEAADFAAHHERAATVWPKPNVYTFDPQRHGRKFALPVWQRWNRTEIEPIPLGSDFSRAGERWPSVAAAIGTKNAWYDSRPATVRRTDGKLTVGLWFALPLYAVDQQGPKGQRPGESTPQFMDRLGAHRARVTRGLLVAFLSTDRLTDQAHNSATRPSRLHVRLYSQREPAPEALLNPSAPPPANPRFRHTVVVPWWGHRWSLEMTSTPLFEAESDRWRAWLLGGGGAGLTLLATTLIGVAIHARVRQERLAAEITEARNTLAISERERADLGDDLHDGAIQSLYAIQLGLTRTAREVADVLPASARVLEETRHRVDIVIAELRRFIHAAARRPEVETPALEHVLASVVQSMRATTLAELSFDASSSATARLTAAQSVALAQVARSALGNALRHAEAAHVAVRLVVDEAGVTLTVEDDGRGFVVAEREGAGEGLRSMRQRATAAGGELELDSKPGRGTRVRVRLRVAAEPVPLEGSGSPGAPSS
jgi:signal transduction histidine kinase